MPAFGKTRPLTVDDFKEFEKAYGKDPNGGSKRKDEGEEGRWRCFTREQANLLSRTVALPVIVGAALLKGFRLRRRGVDRPLRRAMAIGVGASFASTLASPKPARNSTA